MSSISGYFERKHRKEQLNPTSHWFTIGAGILFIVAGAVVEIRSHDLSRALSFTLIGLGMTLFGITQDNLRNSMWHRIAVFAEIALWFGGTCCLVWTLF
jgi:hypothetical protein